jgi:hypothetical protein
MLHAVSQQHRVVGRLACHIQHGTRCPPASPHNLWRAWVVPRRRIGRQRHRETIGNHLPRNPPVRVAGLALRPAVGLSQQLALAIDHVVEGRQRVRQSDERRCQARHRIAPPTCLLRHPVDRGEQEWDDSQ